MELPEPTSRVTILNGKKAGMRAFAKGPRVIEDPRQPHCAEHPVFRAGCPVCKQACANFQPYPVKKGVALSRSFGFTDDITEDKLKALDPKYDSFSEVEPEVSWELSVIRFVLRLIWPFSRIL